jgi:hypothetical protein
MSFKEEQAQKRLDYYQGMSGTMEPPSLMASREEKDSYTAQEVGRGNLPSSELSEAYGGRPTGTTRRAIRMQESYDTERERQLKEAEFSRGIYESDREFQSLSSARAAQIAKFNNEQEDRLASQRLATETEVDVNKFYEGFNKLDPKSETFLEDVGKLRATYGLANGDPRIEKTVEQYGQAYEKYAAGRAAQQEYAEKFNNDLQEVAKASEQSGLPMSNFVTTDPTTGRDVIDREALGRAQAVVAKKAPEEPTFGGKTQKELEAILSGINADIAEAAAGGDAATKVEGLEAKKRYYEGLMPKENKDVANAAKDQYIPASDREANKVYPTPKGEMRWTGSGWTKP